RGGEFIEASTSATRPCGVSPSPPSRRRVHRGPAYPQTTAEVRAKPSPPSRRRVHRGERTMPNAFTSARPPPPSRRRVHRGGITTVVDGTTVDPRRPRGGEFIEAPHTVRRR